MWVVGVFLLAVVLWSWVDNLKKKIRPMTEEALKILDEYSGVFIAQRDIVDILKKIELAKEEIARTASSSLFSFVANSEIRKISHFKENLASKIKKRNDDFVKYEIGRLSDFFSNIDGKSLDFQQSQSVVVDDDYNLVLAGAGSGKTLTISAKVKYLVDVKGVNPDEILLISFTRNSAAEMSDRISEKLNIDIESKTFHKLGLEIISEASRRPDVAEDDFLDKIISHILSGKNTPEDFKQKILLFLGCYLAAPADIDSFESLGEYIDNHRTISLKTLKGRAASSGELLNHKIENLRSNLKTIKNESVKSIEEVLIANFLFLNGVDYIYEPEYPLDTHDKYRKTYHPDFYLPDYDIYLEHFGVNEEFRTPWLSAIEEKKYLNGISWKRQVHSKNKTRLLETYSYYNSQGVLYSKLTQILQQNGVIFKEIPYSDLVDVILESDGREFNDIKKLISSFINLFKSAGKSLGDFSGIRSEISQDSSHFTRTRAGLFIDVVEFIYREYQAKLKKSKKIDFNDMIILATEIIKSGKVKLPYRYIIIDEYQDISAGRFNLVEAIIAQTRAKLMCVGDDWQSIYRFSGSDLSLFTKFGLRVGPFTLTKIEKTYRNSQDLIDIAGKFVMKNPEQFKKDLKSSSRIQDPVKIISYDSVKLLDEMQFSMCSVLRKTILEIVEEFGNKKSILILGRNNFDISPLENEKDDRFSVKKSRNGVARVIFEEMPNLEIQFMTAHKSKGLEADNVILFNLRNDIFGFPNKIADDPILSYVLNDKDEMLYAEERRLFYVALTRTRNRTHIITPDRNGSLFVEELSKDFKIPIRNSAKNPVHCPRCKTGELTLREGPSGSFVGCINYPGCDYSNKNIDILYRAIKCPKCQDFMVKRLRNSDGEAFLGCANYPHCKHTQDIE